MKKTLTLILTFLIGLVISLPLNAQNKVIKLKNINVEILVNNVNIKRIPIMVKGLIRYLQANDNKRIKNYYVKAKHSDSSKNYIKIFVIKYKAKKEVVFRINSNIRIKGEDKIIRLKLGKYDRPRSISSSEKQARSNIKKFFMREGSLNSKEAEQYVTYVVYIAEGIDKAFRR